MRLPAQLQPPDAPYLCPSTLTESDQALNRLLNGNLEAMSSHLEEFCEAAALRGFCMGQRTAVPDPHLFARWEYLAARQCIVSLYNYREAMDAAHRTLTRQPWAKHIDTKSLEVTKDAFRAEYPNTRELRQTVLHDAERHATPSRFDVNKVRDGRHLMTDGGGCLIELSGGSTMTMGSCFVDNRYVSNFNGQVVELDLDFKKLERLVSLTQDYYRAVDQQHLAT